MLSLLAVYPATAAAAAPSSSRRGSPSTLTKCPRNGSVRMESDGIASSMARPAPPSPRTPEHIDTTLPSAPPAESSQQHQLPASQSSAVTRPLNRVSCSSEQPGPGATAPSTGDLELGSVDLSRSTTPTTLVAGRGGFAALEGPRGGARAAKDVGSDAVVGADNAGRWRGHAAKDVGSSAVIVGASW